MTRPPDARVCVTPRPAFSRMLLFPAALWAGDAWAASGATAPVLPRALSTYAEQPGTGLWDALVLRVQAEPFNLVTTVIFLLAIVHTFLTAKIRHWAHEAEAAHASRTANSGQPGEFDEDGNPKEVSFKGQLLHFLGEIEAVFGIWAVVLAAAIALRFGWDAVLGYIGNTVNFTEPLFVVVIMAIAATRPVLGLAESLLRTIAGAGRRSVGAWWLAILIVAPLLGSFITEPAAMTIGALMLSQQFYPLKPPPRLAYATLGLLFVNVSVGGTLTHFAAPPVLMVAGPWNWNTPFMMAHFGWKAVIGIVASSFLYYLVFRRELAALERRRLESLSTAAAPRSAPPVWITAVHLGFLAFTVVVAHFPPLFIGGFLFFLAFAQATAHHQSTIQLRGPLLVGFFLAGLVVHGGLQGWWIEPVLRRLGEFPLFLGATGLTAFNDNAAITYLATLVPGFTESLKYAVVAGAVTGGGLTVIANAPNPAGQSILQRFFPDGVSPLNLALAALVPTVVMSVCFLLLP